MMRSSDRSNWTSAILHKKRGKHSSFLKDARQILQATHFFLIKTGSPEDRSNICSKGFHGHKEPCSAGNYSLHGFRGAGLCFDATRWSSLLQSYIPFKRTRHMETNGDVVHLDVQ